MHLLRRVAFHELFTCNDGVVRTRVTVVVGELVIPPETPVSDLLIDGRPLRDLVSADFELEPDAALPTIVRSG